MRMRKLYETQGGALSRPDREAFLASTRIRRSPTPEELAREYSGKALKDLADPKNPTKITRKAGEQLAGFAELRNDGSTARGCWIFCGAWGPTGNLMARRDNSDPTGIGQTVNWALAWPANRRVLYNRASCDPSGKPFNPSRKLIVLERHGLEWRGHSGLQGRRGSRRRHGTLHHESGRGGAILRAGATWPRVPSPSITSPSRRRSRRTP